MLALFPGPLRSSAQETILGSPAPVTSHGVVNFRMLELLEPGMNPTNRPMRPLFAPKPLPERIEDQNGAQPSAGQGMFAPAAAPDSLGLESGSFQLAAVSPAPAVTFLGLDDDGTEYVPGTQGAVGPNHILVALNSQVRIMDRQGTPISTTSLATFWASAIGVFGLPFFPKVAYDPYGERWIMTALASSGSRVLIGVSQTSDPTGNWNRYSIVSDGQYYYYNYADGPNLGFNKDWIVVTANMIPYYGLISQYNGVNIYAFDKWSLYTRGQTNVTPLVTVLNIPGNTAFAMVPSIVYDDAFPEIYFVEVDGLLQNPYGASRRLRLSKLTGTVGNEIVQIGIGYTTNLISWASSEPVGGMAPQLGSPRLISLDDSRIQSLAFRNGSLWCAHTVFLPSASPIRSAVQWWQLSTNAATLQWGRIEDPTGERFYAYPSLAVNHCNDVLIGFSGFSANQYASACYSFRFNSDLPNTMQDPVIYKPGEGPFDYGLFGINRWGDWSATAVDPANDLDMWTLQEYAATPDPRTLQARWGTWWAKLDVASVAQCGQIEFAAKTFTVSEGTTNGMAVITVTNFTGLAGSVDFATSDGTAVAGVNYLPRNGTLNFGPGQRSTNFTVLILDDGVVNSNRTVNLDLSNPTGGLSLGALGHSTLIIQDDEYVPAPNIAGEFNFSTYFRTNRYYSGAYYYYGYPYYLVTENETFTFPCGRDDYTVYLPDRTADGALVTITRTGEAKGKVMVDFMTTEGGNAIPNYDYIPVTNTLIFDDYQMSTNVLIPIYYNYYYGPYYYDIGHRFIRCVLTNPRPVPEEEQARPGMIRPTLGPGSETSIMILSINSGYQYITAFSNNIPIVTNMNTFAFERMNYRVDEYDDVTINGDYRRVNVQVILPFTGPGRVRLRTTAPNRIYFYYPRYVQSGSDDADGRDDLSTAVFRNPVFTDPTLTTITNYSDFLATNMVVDFGDRDCRKNITLYIQNDPAPEFDEDIVLYLEYIDEPNNPPVNPWMGQTTVTILYHDAPAGALDREWNPDNISQTSPSYNLTPGANNVVLAVAVQPDGRTLLAGDFTAVNGVSRNRIARMNFDGSLDTLFEPATGADRVINALLLYPLSTTNAGKILIGGGFTSFNGYQRNGIARVLDDGRLDTSFRPGNGANGIVTSIALQSDGRVVVVGDFTEFNDQPRNGIARLDPDGSLDPGFVLSPGPNGLISAVAVTPAFYGVEKILIAGNFTTINGQTAIRVAQLNPDATLDPTFSAGGGPNGPVFALTVQTNGAVLVAGDFSEVNNNQRMRIARLHTDGSLDFGFDPYYGANDTVYALTLQPDGKILAGGRFTEYNTTRRMGLARLRWDGTLDTTFLDTAYNQYAGLVNAFSFLPPNSVRAIAVQPDNDIIIGGTFTTVGGNPSYRATRRNYYTVFTRADKRNRYNIARLLGGATPGPGNAEFTSADYYTDENALTASIRLRRVDGRLGTLLGAAVTHQRLATPGLDYIATTNANAWREGVWDLPTPWSVAEINPIYYPIPLLDDTLIEGDELVNLDFLRAVGNVNLAGEIIPLGGALGQHSAVLHIAENDFPAGEFNFLYSNFITNENAVKARIFVTRTNGSVGAVAVDYFTRPSRTPPIATAWEDYRPASGRLSFYSGQTLNYFDVEITPDTLVEFDETVELVLTNASGGAILPGGTPISTATALLTIVDDDFSAGRLNFSASGFTNSESQGAATITVSRTGGNYRQVSVEFRTLDGTATSPDDYLATNGILRWDDGDILPKTFTVPLRADGLIEGTETVRLELFNPKVGMAPDQTLLGLRTNAVLSIADGDAYGSLAFKQPYYQAGENGGFITISVVRYGGSAGTVSINYTARAGTAVPGADFIPTSGVLTLGPGQLSTNFTVALLDDAVSDGNKTVWLELSNPGPTNTVLGVPGQVLLTLVDNESYNEPAGLLDTFFSPETQANGPVNALALQVGTNGLPDGRLLVAGDFTEVNQNLRNRLARLLTNGMLDAAFDVGAGPNNNVRALAVQRDGRVLIGGFFSQVASTNRNGIARLYPDGTLDGTFNPGSGADNPVYSIYILPDDKILVGGAFSRFNSVNRPGLVRLDTNGVVDLLFNAGSGPNGPVYAMALQSDGKIVLGGEFNVVNGVPCNHLARLFPNGAVDTGFAIGAGMDAAVWALVIQPDGKIIAGGSFTNFNGVTRNRLARLYPDGQLDLDYLGTSGGADNVVFALAQQPDGKLVVGGDFTTFNGLMRNRLTRLNLDGTTDYTINFGSGANGFIGALLIQPDRKIVLGGGFTTYDDQPRLRIARIHGGSTAGVGTLEFSQPIFYADEMGTNALVTVRRRGGTTGIVGAKFSTMDGTALAGRDYLATNGTLSFNEGEIWQQFLIPVLDNAEANEDRRFYVDLYDFTGGTTNGPRPGTAVIIRNDEPLVGFSSGTFSVSEGVASGTATISVNRSLATNSVATVEFAAVGGLGAMAGLDFEATNGVLVFLPGEVTKSFHVRIFNDNFIEGNETILLQLLNPGANVHLGLAQADLAIVDDDFGPGELAFSAPVYGFSESARFADITILRTNGSSGVIALNYATADGTALTGQDYTGMSGRLTYADGQTSQTISIPISDDAIVEGNEYFTIQISNPTGGASISGPAVVSVVIEDNEFGPGSLDPAFDPGAGANDLVRALAVQPDGKILVGGAFTNFDNAPHFYVARLEPQGALDTNFNARANALVTAVAALPGNKVAIAGNFSQANGTNRNRVAAFLEDGALDLGFVASNAFNAALYSMLAQPDGKLLAGGGFTLPMSGIIRLLGGGVVDVSFMPGAGADNVVYSVALQPDGKALLAGEFNYVNRIARSGVARLYEDGMVDDGFRPPLVSGGVIYTVAAAPDGKVVIGGDFTALDGVPRSRVARLNADGSLDTTFAPDTADGPVFAIGVEPDGKIIIGGAFTQIGSAARSRIARLALNGSVDLTFDPGRGVDNTVYAIILLPDGKVLIGGSFTSVNGFVRRGVARLNGDDAPIRLNPVGMAGGQFSLQLPCRTGARYVFEVSSDLRNWNSLSTNTAVGTTLQFTDPNSGLFNWRFYRARLATP